MSVSEQSHYTVAGECSSLSVNDRESQGLVTAGTMWGPGREGRRKVQFLAGLDEREGRP